MTLSRRHFLTTALSSISSLAIPGFALEATQSDVDYVLIAEETPITLLPNTSTPAMTFNGNFPAPVLRARQGKPVRILFKNRLREPTTVHWHGIRLANAMDGVACLTQDPVLPGESFLYDFVCPDAGTFWYHPHMNSVEQLGRGLVGMLLVEEDQPVGFHVDLALGLKDWRLNKDGSFMPLSDLRSAARAGTLGNVATINGQIAPTFSVPAGGNVRLRLANMDNTRVFHIASNEILQVIALDGNPIAAPYPLQSHPLGSGMRLDLAVQVPDAIGEEIILYDQKGRLKFEMCRLRIEPSIWPKRALPKLPMNPVPEPDMASATVIPLVFEWEGVLSRTDANGDVDSTFWTINKRAWQEDGHHNPPPPLATLELGKSYIFDLYNATPNHHPIHLHGHTFTVLTSNKRDIVPYHTDTILLDKYERAQVALVADNPGDWMMHCHVVEHMKTGFMGFVRVV